MRFGSGALAGAGLATAVLTLAVAGCGWIDPAPSVGVGPDAPHPPVGPGGTQLRSAGFGLPPVFDARLYPASAAPAAGPPPATAKAAAAPDLQPVPRARQERDTPPTTPPGPTIPTRDVLLDGPGPINAVAPIAIRIPAHGVGNPVVPVGVDAATGELSVPPDPSQVGWYRFGSSPGSAGSAVLAGHVDWKGQPGAFIDLDQVQPGERVEIDLGDGTTHAFVVVETHLIAKTELPAELFERDGPPKLVLITCGGEFDRSIHRYRQNVVVVAAPA